MYAAFPYVAAISAARRISHGANGWRRKPDSWRHDDALPPDMALLGDHFMATAHHRAPFSIFLDAKAAAVARFHLPAMSMLIDWLRFALLSGRGFHHRGGKHVLARNGDSGHVMPGALMNELRPGTMTLIDL